jgi:ligand-binding sensor domain-containing protein/two-component sensor histidine kinase
MRTYSFYRLILLLLITASVYGQDQYVLNKFDTIQLVWKPISGTPKQLKVKINNSKTIKENLPKVIQNSFTKTLITLKPDTLYLKDFDKPIKGKIQIIEKPFLPNKKIKASSLIFKDNVNNNIVYQDLAHGFFSNSIRCIKQDGDGYIWIGSDGTGLCKYDGFTYSIYNKNSNLTSNVISNILFDSKKRLWICTESGLSYAQNEKLYIINIPEIENINVAAIVEDNNGEIWIGTEKNGLINLKKDSYIIYNEKSGFPGNVVRSIHHDETGDFWAGLDDRKGFIRFNDEKILHYKLNGGIPNNVLMTFLEDDQGLWAGFFEGGLLQFKNDSIWRYDFFKPHYDNIFSLAKNENGYWLNVYGKGIANLNQNGIKYFTNEEGVKGSSTYKVFVDNNNNVWSADLMAGISRINENLFSTLDHEVFKRNIPNIINDNKGNNWFTSNGSSIVKEDKKGNLTAYYNKGNNQTKRSYHNYDITFKGNNTWSTSYGLGAIKISEKEFKFHYFTELGLLGNILLSAETDLNGNIWFSSMDHGVIKYDGTHFYLIDKLNGLVSNKITNLFSDSKENIWIGTREGLNLINKNKITTIEALKNKKINCFYEDQNGDIWIGSEEDGLYILKNNTLFKINENQGIISNSIRSIIKGDDGRFWIATSKGISVLKFTDELLYESRNFGIEYGTFLNDFNSAVHKYNDGSIIWGSNTRQVVRYNPNNERKELKGPKLIIKTFFKNNNLPEKIKRKNIIIDPSEELTINYTALDWGYENKINFEYTLTNTNDTINKWISNDRNTSLTLKNIPTGHYHLQVKAIGANGVTISPKIKLSFKPFWWETIWFKIALGLFVLILFFIFYKLRTQKLLQKQIELENAVAEKTIVIENEKERLKKQNIIIEEQKNENEFLLKEANHRINNNLQLITILISEELKKQDVKDLKISNNLLPKIESIATLHRHLYKSDQKQKVDLSEYLVEVNDNFQFLFESNNIQLNSSVQSIKVLIDSAMYFGLLLTELYINTLKYSFDHSQNKLINLNIVYSNNSLNFKYQDNGLLAKGKEIKPKVALKLMRQLKAKHIIDTQEGFCLSFNKKLLNE